MSTCPDGAGLLYALLRAAAAGRPLGTGAAAGGSARRLQGVRLREKWLGISYTLQHLDGKLHKDASDVAWEDVLSS